MSDRRADLAAVLRLYLDAPGAPAKVSRADWAVAATLLQRATPLATFAHAIRLATLRRARPGQPLEPVRSLAYYRRVLDQLTPADLDPDYVTYVRHRYLALRDSLPAKALNAALLNSQNPALSRRR